MEQARTEQGHTPELGSWSPTLGKGFASYGSERTLRQALFKVVSSRVVLMPSSTRTCSSRPCCAWQSGGTAVPERTVTQEQTFRKLMS